MAITLPLLSLTGIGSVQAQTFTLLYSFQGGPTDGKTPSGQLVFDKAGNLYGTTVEGGNSTKGAGTIFKFDTSGNESVLYNFTGSKGDGESPIGGLVRYGGHIFGTTVSGGGGCRPVAGCGTLFEINERGRETFRFKFSGDDGFVSQSGLSRDAAGNLYGTTTIGGPLRYGTVFEVKQGQVAVIHTFSGADGQDPESGVVADRVGNLYGTTVNGGAFGFGAVYELSPSADGTWTERVLHSFSSKEEGLAPQAGLVLDAQGNLYGSTNFGGKITVCSNGCGVVFKLKRNEDGTWTERVLHAFTGPPDDGRDSDAATLVRDKQGNLYGVTYAGGAFDRGVIFKIDSSGNETVLHSFQGGQTDGAFPNAGLTMDASGNLYGTTERGGVWCPALNGCGTIFKITP